MKLSEQLQQDHNSGDFGNALEGYADRAKQPAPPKCHFKTMSFQDGEDESWWECDYCGHTKSVSNFWKA